MTRRSSAGPEVAQGESSQGAVTVEPAIKPFVIHGLELLGRLMRVKTLTCRGQESAPAIRPPRH
jgi:hypothetical protein